MLIRNLLYILQLGNYEINNFLKFSYSHWPWYNLQKKGALRWTRKIFFIYFSTLLLISLFIFFSLYVFKYWGVVMVILLVLFLPILLSVSCLLITPFDLITRNRMIKRARKILDKHRESLTIIGITGSYGKTSTKEILFAMLERKFRVIKFDGNINTDIGIAAAIIARDIDLTECDVLIVEMGAYRLGDIRKICRYVQPDYSILTGINEAHLEKFGTIDNTIRAKFELPEMTKKVSILNFNDKNVADNYEKFKIKNAIILKSDGVEIQAIENFGGLNFIIDGIVFQTRLLAKHNIDLILLCIEMAKLMGICVSDLVGVIRDIQYFKHRLEPINNPVSGVCVIDDSYNGNLKGFESGLEVLNRALGRRIIITPGLVEQGSAMIDIHHGIGAMYINAGIDLVLLIKNKATKYIVEEMDKRNFRDYKVYETTMAAHADLHNLLRTGDTILFQNDWSDNYF